MHVIEPCFSVIFLLHAWSLQHGRERGFVFAFRLPPRRKKPSINTSLNVPPLKGNQYFPSSLWWDRMYNSNQCLHPPAWAWSQGNSKSTGISRSHQHRTGEFPRASEGTSDRDSKESVLATTCYDSGLKNLPPSADCTLNDCLIFL